MVCSAAVSAQFVAGKATRDALFLASSDVTSLPGAVALTAALSIGLVAVSAVALRRWAPGVLVPAAFSVSAALMLVLWTLLDRFAVAVAWGFYLLVSGLGPVLGSAFWLTVSERFDPRSARRYFSQIAGVGTLAGLVGALAAERVGAVYGVPAMLPLLAALNVACAIAVARVSAVAQTALDSVELASEASELLVDSPRSGLRALARTPYLRHLALLVFCGTVGATLADYVFKAAAAGAVGSGDGLLRFFAIYYAAVSIVAFAVQATASSLALERFGLAAASSTPSLALAVGGTLAMVVPGLPGAIMARAGESIFRGSLFKTGYEIFFTPVSPQDKRAAKSMIDVGFDRLGDVAGGALVALLLLVPVGAAHQRLLGAAVACSVAALMAARRLSTGYVQTLEQRLVDRALDLDLGDATDLTTRTLMLRTLQSSSPVSGVGTSRASAPSFAPLEDRFVAADDLHEIVALRSRDADRVRAVLGQGDGLPATLVPHVIPILAWDPVADAAIRALQGVAEEHVGAFVDALLDPNLPFAARRRLARVFSVCVSQRAADGLLLGLEDLRFEVRFHCGRSLAAVVEKNALIKLDRERVFALVRREVAVGRPVWESQRLLDDVDNSSFEEAVVRRRAGQSLAHVFTLLSTVLPTVPLQIAYKGLQTDDASLRGTALEYLEEVLPRDIRDRLWPYLGDATSPMGASKSTRDREQVLAALMRSDESIAVNLRELRRRLDEPVSTGGE
jgi:hypothetical protein